jgi:sodium pump decarboxylase gamma subunit
MDIEALLLQSLELLGLGMGAVFIILVALIVIISIVSKLVPEEVSAVPAPKEPGVDPAHIAAISAAIHLHRKNR